MASPAQRQRTMARTGPPARSAPPSGHLMNQADGSIGDWHDADITPETIIPPWYGERLDPGLRHLHLLRQRGQPGPPAVQRAAAGPGRPGGAGRPGGPRG